MKRLGIVMVILCTSIGSFAQFHTGSCIINYTINRKDAIVLNNYFVSNNYQNKWNETILKLQEALSSVSTSNKKIEIRNDTLQIADKIYIKRKVQYNISKFPLKKLIDVTFSFNELIIYTKWKEIVVERYQYKKLKTSQITILKKVIEGEHTKLLALLNKIETINRFREKL